MEEASWTFRTTTGTCTITSDHIVLSRKGMKGAIARIVYGKSSSARARVGSLIVGGISLGAGILSLVDGWYLWGGLLTVAGLLRLAAVGLGTPSAHIVPFIDRSDIQAVKAFEPSQSSNRGGHFTVSFKCDGKIEQLAIAPSWRSRRVRHRAHGDA